MKILKEIDANSTNRRISGRKSMLVLSDDEDEEDYDTAVGIKPKSNKPRNSLYIESDDDEEDSDGYLSPLEHDKENKKANEKSKRKQHPDSNKKVKGRVSAHNGIPKKTPNPKPKKRRRRSSARFLRLSGRFGDDENNGLLDEAQEEEQQEKLNEMYSQAIQLNAANKINAGNSWGLNIIDKMDKFLGDDEDEGNSSPVHDVEEDTSRRGKESNGKEKRVNFTKASCTIDACVKIYSYRVDDAHLTSYKVLANLNRTDGGKNSGNDVRNEKDDASDQDNGTSQRSYAKRRESTAAVKTVETNAANLNISKLDSAYDIDPIFHKMSQKFDEGGAKGLLLVNLGVANDGCRIVLDSKEDSADAVEPALIEDDAEADEPRQEGMIDISNLLRALDNKNPSSMESIHFVPQLEELRHTYAVLEEEGFVEAGKAMKSKSFRYANNAAEDKAAEEAIHREAIERSTASGIQRTSFMLPNTSMNISAMFSNTSRQSNSTDYEADDYGGDYNDYDDGDDGGFENFVTMDDHAKKYSSDSFRNDLTLDEFGNATSKDSTGTTANNASGTATFLDEICAGDALTQGSKYNYFNPNVIEKLTSGNQWAGSDHWKKNRVIRQKKEMKKIAEEKPRKEQKRKNTKLVEEKSFIDLEISDFHECLNSLLNKKKKEKSAGKCAMTKASIKKCENERNILPLDAGINASHFDEFFLRPGAHLKQISADYSPESKTVGFLGIDTHQFDDGDENSYDDGPGFDLAVSDDINETEVEDFAVKELQGIRKVEKVRVSHATVAKKVDVKRLKKDLWFELETSTAPTQAETIKEHDVEDMHIQEEMIDDCMEEKVVSFKNTVNKLGATEAQEDVSLPFYFICVLHLANEKGLKLENGEHGLNDFVISRDSDMPLPVD